MKIIVAGGTGWIGSALCQSLLADRHDVIILSRAAAHGRQAGAIRHVAWDGRSVGEWASELEDTDAVINLSGESVMSGRWNEERKRRLLTSRTGPTAALIQAMEQAATRPAVLVNASAVGYYGDRGDQTVTESDAPGNDFLARLVVEWEHVAARATELNVRTCMMRTGIVLGPGGGALAQLAMPFRFFMGGYVGTGDQWVSWVHMEDVVGLYRLAVENPNASGPINVTAPEPTTNRELAEGLGEVMGRPSWMPVPGFALRIALGELADSILVGQRAVPAVALRLGYEFKQPSLVPAVRRALSAAA